MLSAWLGVVDEWARDVMASPDSLEAPGTSWITAHFIELETAALFLLSGYSPTARRLAAKLLRTLSGITTHFHDQPVSPLDGLGQDALHILMCSWSNRSPPRTSTTWKSSWNLFISQD